VTGWTPQRRLVWAEAGREATRTNPGGGPVEAVDASVDRCGAHVGPILGHPLSAAVGDWMD